MEVPSTLQGSVDNLRIATVVALPSEKETSVQNQACPTCGHIVFVEGLGKGRRHHLRMLWPPATGTTQCSTWAGRLCASGRPEHSIGLQPVPTLALWPTTLSMMAVVGSNTVTSRPSSSYLRSDRLLDGFDGRFRSDHVLANLPHQGAGGLDLRPAFRILFEPRIANTLRSQWLLKTSSWAQSSPLASVGRAISVRDLLRCHLKDGRAHPAAPMRGGRADAR